ncbi:unnamed protein product [Adineta ricciae]|uniref:NAD(+)--protein-arginine ADP-ribosyltransferase n=1 Tax=Adineta ricciae TaxID=249248 RepID=A0A815QDF4_ADIRI|nr:unnamed protein product [Adineta ricciae]CAF1565053.1 unnamed protein product [Adineta ricciae]
MGQILDGLKNYAYRRRERQNTEARSRANHPETLALDETPRLENRSGVFDLSSAPSLDTMNGVSPRDSDVSSLVNMVLTSATSYRRPTAAANRCSEFYLACRTNDVDKVRQLLQTMSRENINHLEPNGSTALHSACYHGYEQIVELLLNAGADRSILNCFQCLPYDEAKNDTIRRLFFRVPSANRFASDTGEIEWDSINDDAPEDAAQEKQIIKSTYENFSGAGSLWRMFEKIYRNYIGDRLNYIQGIETIKHFFQKAMEEQDPIWIIKAYTAETDFYKILNKEIAGGATTNQNERRYIIALLCHHPIFDHFTFIGRSYRVIQMNEIASRKYRVNEYLMTKSFLSSSVDRKIAELFVYQKEAAKQFGRTRIDGSSIKIWIMCVYEIKNRRTALNVENISQYTSEGEILIMPFSVFRIKRVEPITVRHDLSSQTIRWIELEECQECFDRQVQRATTASSSIVIDRL